MSPTLVVPEGAAAGRRSPPDRLHRSRSWWIAAIVGVLAAGTLAIGESGGVSLSNLSERRLIEAHLDSWYGGDFDTADGLKDPERLPAGPAAERARSEVEYQAALGSRADLLGCEMLPPETLRCDVAYSNVLNDAVGKEPAVLVQQYGIRDGHLLFIAGPYLEDVALTASFRVFANLLFPAEYEAACRDEPGYQTPSCAEFKLAHLGDWASWHRIEEG